MKPETHRRIQMFLAVALILAASRVLWIFYERRQSAQPARPPAAGKLNPDYYVYPPKAYLTSLKSAKAMKGATVWMRDGWRYTSQPWNPARHASSEKKEDARPLAPIQKITIEDVVTEPSPVPGVQMVDFIFQDPSATPPLRSFGVGQCEKDDCRFFVDEMFFLKDPRELYSHWKPEVWQAIEKHEIHEGMSEMQVNFALGVGRPLRGQTRVVEFRPPDRPPVLVTFDKDGYARHIEVTQPAG